MAIASGVLAMDVLKAETVLQAQAPSAKPPPAPTSAPTPPPAKAPAPAAAPIASGPEKINAALPAWTAGCVSKARVAASDCRLEQRLFAKETGRLIAIAVIEIPGSTRQPLLILHLPTGLALQQAVSVTVDSGKAHALQLQSCDANGCYAALPITPVLRDEMKAGKTLIARATAATGEALTFQYLLTDFATTFATVQ